MGLQPFLFSFHIIPPLTFHPLSLAFPFDGDRQYLNTPFFPFLFYFSKKEHIGPLSEPGWYPQSLDFWHFETQNNSLK